MKVKTDLIEQRQQNLQEIIKRGHDPYPHRYELTHTVSELVQFLASKSAQDLEKEPISVQTAGRLINVRVHGKAAFADILGQAERIQVYVRKDRVGEENFELFRLLDLGDALGVRGTMFRTRTGELTILAEGVDFLAKALLPLPEKWHGLADVEIRYRQRYLDLIANPAARAVFVRRSRIISEIRRFLDSRGYLEVETPMMQPIAGGAVARPFKTHHEALDIPLFLRIAPELYLKRLIVGGFDRVYEINRNFRNEGISSQHNPEFTMLEFYQAYSDYRDLMDLTHEMMLTLVENVTGGHEVAFGSETIDFREIRRLSLLGAIQEFWPGKMAPALEELGDLDHVRTLVSTLGGSPAENESWGKLLGLLFDTVAEKKLIQPTIVYDFPAELSPLSKRKDDDPRFAERFEMYIGGMEVANAYSELNDPDEQEQRFREQLEARAHGDEEAHAMDKDYIRALRYGMPPTAGEGIGIDRLTMVLTDSASIREVILFPHLRPEE